jgi:hypothetical protein
MKSEVVKWNVPTLAQLVAQITGENRYKEIPSGPERAKETVEDEIKE